MSDSKQLSDASTNQQVSIPPRSPLPRRKFSGATSDRIPVRFFFWLIVCFLCAGTSLFWAFSGWHRGGVLVGVVLVALIYTLVSGADFARRWRRNPRIEKAIRTGFGLRILLEIVFPIGGVLDMIVGMISVSVANSLGIGRQGATFQVGRETFVATVSTLWIDAIFQNALLWAFILLVYGSLRWTSKEYESNGDRCPRCEYDLRGSRMSARCPECGAPTPWAAESI